MVHPGYRKRTIFLLVALLLVRFWFGQTFELTGQEAYLWLQGHGTNLSPAYWEHGPLVPLLIRIGTSFFGDTEIGVRWLTAVMCCSVGFILFYLARHWFNARTAFWTVLLFIVLPMFAWKLSFMTEAASSIGLMSLALFGFGHAIDEDNGWWWLLAGAACGLGLLVSIANAWWIIGVIFYFVGTHGRRQRLREGWLGGTLVFTTLFLAPLVWWWRGPQVADVAHTRILNAWPLSHPFSFHQGFHFIGLEIFDLSPLFFSVLVFVLTRLGRELWTNHRYRLLVCLAVPGLVWQNFSAFFQEGHIGLVPALCLPLLLLVGCYMVELTLTNRPARIISLAVLVCAGIQTLVGLNPYYFASKVGDSGTEIRRTRNGEHLGRFYAGKRHTSWRNLADAVQSLQQDEGVGATLIITDDPETASALSFYLPHNPFVYVEEKPDVISHFDFWPGYDQSASPNDSALYISHSTNREHPSEPPGPDIIKNFASVSQIPDPPLPDFDKTWDVWNCQNFIGTDSQKPGETPANPMRDSDALPK